MNRHSSTHTLKPENIFLATLCSHPCILFADIGLARDQAWQSTAHIVSTISYLPPEVIQVTCTQERNVRRTAC